METFSCLEGLNKRGRLQLCLFAAGYFDSLKDEKFRKLDFDFNR